MPRHRALRDRREHHVCVWSSVLLGWVNVDVERSEAVLARRGVRSTRERLARDLGVPDWRVRPCLHVIHGAPVRYGVAVVSRGRPLTRAPWYSPRVSRGYSTSWAIPRIRSVMPA